MELDELALACRLSGLPVGDLWLRYLELGGGRSRAQLEARLAGTGWPQQDERYLAVVADEALRERGLPRLVPPVPAPEPCPARHRAPADPVGLGRTAAALLEARTHRNRFAVLFEQCARSRETARGVRERAEALRRDRAAAARPASGGR